MTHTFILKESGRFSAHIIPGSPRAPATDSSRVNLAVSQFSPRFLRLSFIESAHVTSAKMASAGPPYSPCEQTPSLRAPHP